MAIVKLTKSKKGVMFIADDGVGYLCAASVLSRLLDGKSKLILLSKLPLKISLDRFKQSDVWNPGGIKSLDNDKNVSTNTDGLSTRSRNRVSQGRNYIDKVVDL